MLGGRRNDGDKHSFAHAPLHGAAEQIAFRACVQSRRLRRRQTQFRCRQARLQRFQNGGFALPCRIAQFGGFLQQGVETRLQIVNLVIQIKIHFAAAHVRRFDFF